MGTPSNGYTIMSIDEVPTASGKRRLLTKKQLRSTCDWAISVFQFSWYLLGGSLRYTYEVSETRFHKQSFRNRARYTKKRFGEILFGKHVERYRCQVCKMADRHAVVAACASIIIRLIVKKRKRRRRNRTIWVREWIKNREVHGAYNSL